MAIAFDAYSESGVNTTGSPTWNHTPVGTPRGVVVFVINAATTDDSISGVTYGGVSMTEVTGSPISYSSGDTTNISCFFLGSSIPTGVQEVVATDNGTGTSKGAYCVTYTADADTEVNATDWYNTPGTQTSVEEALALGGVTSAVVEGVFQGNSSPVFSPLTGWTEQHERDTGAHGRALATYDTVGSSDLTFGGTLSTADDIVPFVIAIKEAAGGGATGTGALTTTATTASGSGVLSHTGTGAATTGNVTASGAGTLGHTGTGALTTIVSTLSGAGVLTHVGTGSLTTTATTLSGTGTVTAAGEITGTGALTTSVVTASGSGVLSHTGTGALSTSVVTLDGAGVLTHTGTGALTTQVTGISGTGTVLGTITGTGALTTNKVTLSGYDVLPVSETPAGGGKGSTSKPAKRQKLIIVEQIDDVEELVEQVQEIIKTEPRKKLAKKVKKPAVSLQESPQAAFDWIGYYQAQLDALRDQQRAESLKQQLARNAQIIQAILENQANNAILSAQESEYARLREEEDFLLLLMAA